MQHSRIIHASTCRTTGNRSIIWSELLKEETNLWFKPWAQISWRWRYFRVLFLYFYHFPVIDANLRTTRAPGSTGAVPASAVAHFGVSGGRLAPDVPRMRESLEGPSHLVGGGSGWGPLPGTPLRATGPLPALRYSLTAPLLVNSPSTGFCGQPSEPPLTCASHALPVLFPSRRCFLASFCERTVFESTVYPVACFCRTRGERGTKGNSLPAAPLPEDPVLPLAGSECRNFQSSGHPLAGPSCCSRGQLPVPRALLPAPRWPEKHPQWRGEACTWPRHPAGNPRGSHPKLGRANRQCSQMSASLWCLWSRESQRTATYIHPSKRPQQLPCGHGHGVMSPAKRRIYPKCSPSFYFFSLCVCVYFLTYNTSNI